MLDELKEEQIVNKVGGRFKLSTLIQKRMVMLNTGARPLVEVRGGAGNARRRRQDDDYARGRPRFVTHRVLPAAGAVGGNDSPSAPSIKPLLPGRSSRA